MNTNSVIDAFKEKAIESYFMRKFKNVLGVRITKETNEDLHTEYFVISFAFRIEERIIYTSLAAGSLKLPMTNLEKELVNEFHLHLQNNVETIEEEDVEGEFKEQYLYFTGRHIPEFPTIFYKTVKETDLSANMEDIVLEIKNKLSEAKDTPLFQSEEWEYFKNNRKKNYVEKAFCESCEKEKILREEEYDCSDTCWDCYNRIDNARRNIIQRTNAAVHYLRSSDKNNPKLEMASFLDIFHPELSERKKMEIIKETK